MLKVVGIELNAVSCPEKLEGGPHLEELLQETMTFSEDIVSQKGILEEKGWKML